jgi:hypothetical protein|tara:strand:- start:4749 stop:4991 length:243 start_codon:yes stop_codon:yes gene_type:complete
MFEHSFEQLSGKSAAWMNYLSGDGLLDGAVTPFRLGLPPLSPAPLLLYHGQKLRSKANSHKRRQPNKKSAFGDDRRKTAV